MTDALWILSAWLMADFMSGVFHWWEDRYGVEDWPIVGPLIVSPNVMHHTQPRAFLEGNILQRNWTTAVPAGLLAACFAWAGWYWMATACAFTGVGNEVHAWAHQKCCRQIRGLQMLGILQSQEQHSQHHTQPFSENYCVMTDLVNPVLERAGFWRGAEWVIRQCGVPPRPEREMA
jgi:hypothetical protein